MSKNLFSKLFILTILLFKLSLLYATIGGSNNSPSLPINEELDERQTGCMSNILSCPTIPTVFENNRCCNHCDNATCGVCCCIDSYYPTGCTREFADSDNCMISRCALCSQSAYIPAYYASTAFVNAMHWSSCASCAAGSVVYCAACAVSGLAGWILCELPVQAMPYIFEWTTCDWPLVCGNTGEHQRLLR